MQQQHQQQQRGPQMAARQIRPPPQRKNSEHAAVFSGKETSSADWYMHQLWLANDTCAVCLERLQDWPPAQTNHAAPESSSCERFNDSQIHAYPTTTMTPCRHMFHLACLNEALRHSRKHIADEEEDDDADEPQQNQTDADRMDTSVNDLMDWESWVVPDEPHEGAARGDCETSDMDMGVDGGSGGGVGTAKGKGDDGDEAGSVEDATNQDPWPTPTPMQEDGMHPLLQSDKDHAPVECPLCRHRWRPMPLNAADVELWGACIRGDVAAVHTWARRWGWMALWHFLTEGQGIRFIKCCGQLSPHTAPLMEALALVGRVTRADVQMMRYQGLRLLDWIAEKKRTGAGVAQLLRLGLVQTEDLLAFQARAIQLALINSAHNAAMVYLRHLKPGQLPEWMWDMAAIRYANASTLAELSRLRPRRLTPTDFSSLTWSTWGWTGNGPTSVGSNPQQLSRVLPPQRIGSASAANCWPAATMDTLACWKESCHRVWQRLVMRCRQLLLSRLSDPGSEAEGDTPYTRFTSQDAAREQHAETPHSPLSV